MPNLFAYAALAVWPIISIAMFATMASHRALVWSVICSYFLLPVGTSFDLPGVPALDKTTIPNLSILIGCVLFAKGKWLAAIKQPVIVMLTFCFVLSPFITALANPEPLLFGGKALPGMTLYDGLAQAASNAIILIPFIAAYGLIRTERQRYDVIAILLAAVLAYSILMLFEVRFSPQLHRWVYGYFPHSFAQQVRDGGFRPVIFLGHGLLVAIICAMGLAAGIAKWRVTDGRLRQGAALAASYLAFVLLLCKSLGALLLSSVFVPAIAFMRARSLAFLSSAICILILFYPVARASGVLPLDWIMETVEAYSDDRAGSFNVRLINEEQLLQRAAIKPITGWGSWGRNRVYSADDGRDESITDGTWIIVFGSWGWLGYLAMFGLLCLGPLSLLIKRFPARYLSITLSGLLSILAINLLDSAPNSSIRPITWVLAGLAASGALGPVGSQPPVRRSIIT